MIIGIDASNIRSGGGLAHLTEILKNINIFISFYTLAGLRILKVLIF